MITIYNILLYSGIIIGSILVLAIAVMAIACVFTGSVGLFMKKPEKPESEKDIRITVYFERDKERDR